MPAREDQDPKVSQASGMISVQAECTVAEALVLMKDRARVTGQSLAEIAVATLDRSIRFEQSA